MEINSFPFDIRKGRQKVLLVFGKFPKLTKLPLLVQQCNGLLSWLNKKSKVPPFWYLNQNRCDRNQMTPGGKTVDLKGLPGHTSVL